MFPAGGRQALRCMARAGLITQLSPEVVPPRLSSGVFPVEADRFDRRQEAVGFCGYF